MDYTEVSSEFQSKSGSKENKIDYITDEYSELSYLDKGIHRAVFEVTPQMVLKLPFNSEGVHKNKIEFYNWKSVQETHYKEWFCPIDILNSDKNGSYIGMEFVDISIDCEQKVVANIKRVVEDVETGRDNFGRHESLGAVVVDYTEPLEKEYRCQEYPL